jgi:hypothetical protein
MALGSSVGRKDPVPIGFFKLMASRLPLLLCSPDRSYSLLMKLTQGISILSWGAVAHTIRAALLEFQLWQVDWSEADLSQVVQNISEGNEKALSILYPSGFAKGFRGSYISTVTA